MIRLNGQVIQDCFKLIKFKVHVLNNQNIEWARFMVLNVIYNNILVISVFLV